MSNGKSRKSSSSSDEATSGGGGGSLKKGPWTTAEDAILVEYVTKHGEGNWNAVQTHSGLSRCGKSCRLRWANHLRPDLKKGAFTQEEEDQIIQLHVTWGNKWARMAAELPGRTDNEIKNYWNTRIKRLQRAGLPIYPPELHVAQNESQEYEDMLASHDGDPYHSDASQPNSFEIPEVKFEHLDISQELLKCSPTLFDIPTSNLHKNLDPSHNFEFMLSSLSPNKRLRETENQCHSSVTSTSNDFPSFDQYEDGDPFERLAPVQSIWLPSHDSDIKINLPSPFEVSGSHAPINGNFSSSEPHLSEDMKLELPSLQYSASQTGRRWSTPSSPLPSFEHANTLIQSPLHEHTRSNGPSPKNSGLLEAIVYESKSLNNTQRKISEACVVSADGVESSSQNVFEIKWDACGDPISPLSQSAASVFVEYTPVSVGCSTDEPHSAETVTESRIQPEAGNWFSVAESEIKKDSLYPLDYRNLRPDALFESMCSGHRIGRSKDHAIIDDVGALFNDDMDFECNKQSDALPSESHQNFGAGSSTMGNNSSANQFTNK